MILLGRKLPCVRVSHSISAYMNFWRSVQVSVALIQLTLWTGDALDDFRSQAGVALDDFRSQAGVALDDFRSQPVALEHDAVKRVAIKQ